MYGRIQSDPSIWMIEQFYQDQFASVGSLAQFFKGCNHLIISCIALFVVAAVCTTTMLRSCSNVTVLRIDHNSLRSLVAQDALQLFHPKFILRFKGLPS